ncbi:MAG: hypothetical protein GYA24_18135, partial [Candidatus Lokiarchaeota archaeon]|nr:hypothetical protein [Candidatus Lokiarchaeota archaeon]
MTETNPVPPTVSAPSPSPAPAADDVTARVLAAAKSLRDGFEDAYAAAAAKIKKEVEGPVKVIDTGDDIPITMQLSVWDTKMGPQPAMLVGSAAQLATISPSEQDDTTRLMDFMEPGATCDLSKGGRNRLLHKFTIADPGARGGDSWFSLAIYYTPAVDVPKEVIEELLVETARSWHDDASLAAEALAIREAYNPATSRWREYLQEIRLSTWALVQKATEMHLPPVPIPGMTEAETAAIFKGQPSPAGRDVEVPATDPAPTPRKKRAKSRPEAEIAAFFSKLARATLDAKDRARQAFEARVAARKQLVVPPVGDVVAGASPTSTPPAAATPVTSDAAPIPPPPSPLPAAPPAPVAGQVAPGFPAAPPPPVSAPSLPPAPAPPAPEEPAAEEAPTSLQDGEGEEVPYPGQDPDADPLDALAARGDGAPVPIQITPAKPAPILATPTAVPTTPSVAKARLVPVEAALVEVLGKLQRSGYSLKVNKETGEATACKLVELDPGKGGLLGLFLSFHARFLPHAVLHEIDGRFYAGDERVATTPHRPSMRAAIAANLHGVQDIVYKGTSIGKVYKERPFKPVIIPLVLVRSGIEGSSGSIPFKWVEPSPSDGIEHGHLVVAAPAIDRAEAFVMNCVRVLGPRMVAAEAAHVT